jgi:hypothetical protein
VNRHERKREDRILALLEQVLVNQNKLLDLWLGQTETLPTEAPKERSYDDAYYLQHLQEAARYGYDDAEAILADANRLEAYLAQFRN